MLPLQLLHSRETLPSQAAPKISALLNTISETQLRRWVEQIAIPRHFGAEPAQNRATADFIVSQFESFGFQVQRQGPYQNLIATSTETPIPAEAILVGAHYDSIPYCPGADDNASAVAAMLGCAAATSLWRPALPIIFVAFNCEEDSLRGSRDFAENFEAPFKIRCAHILEMVGYATTAPNTQRYPPGLPITGPTTADFLALISNSNSTPHLHSTLTAAATYTRELPVTGLAVKLGLEKLFPVLLRSDHASLWQKQIPALMWTDTSEFRNPNYHLDRDTPDTLNYPFLTQVTRLLTATVIKASQ